MFEDDQKQVGGIFGGFTSCPNSTAALHFGNAGSVFTSMRMDLWFQQQPNG